MGSSYGRIFTIATFGESHGPAVGVVVQGCPANLPFDEAAIQAQLDRRRPGQSSITTPRKEEDVLEVLSGVFEGRTLGTPICMMVRNANVRSRDYDEMSELYRPSHADYAYQAKFGHRAWPGGGRASARETIGRVAAGALAMQVLGRLHPAMEIISWVEQVGTIRAGADDSAVTAAMVESNIVRCPSADKAAAMEALIREVRHRGDSIGGMVRLLVRNPPVGLGEPVLHKLDAELAAAMMGLPAVKAVEIGSGFSSLGMTGSQHNDIFYSESGRIRTRGNHSGGIQGGISNGETIALNVVFKPTATILAEQATVNQRGEEVSFKGRGRHDPCVLPRAVPIVDAMAALVLCDLLLWHRGKTLAES